MLFKKMHSYSAILFIMMWYCMKVISMEMSAPKHDNNSILIGFLGSFEHNRSAILIAGAATLAVEHVNNRTDLLPDHVLKFIPGDSGQPNSSQAIRTMTQMKDDGVVAFIGPDHDCACAALTAAAWNLPMISYHCTDQKLSEKKIYTTFARTYPTVTKITNSVIALLLNYNWTTIRLIVSEQPSSTQVEEAFMCFAKEHEITVTKIYHLPLYHNSATKPNFTEIIEDSRNVNRVYVLLTEYYVLLDFVRAMNSSNLAATGLYQIIYVEHEKLRKGRFQFIKDYEGVALHHVRNSLLYRNPFRSALIIEPTYTIPKALQEQIRIYGSRKPFNIPYLEMFPYTVPPHASLLYDAIVLYARAATDVLKEGKSLKDGKEIFNHINSTEYESVLNFTVKIDKDGNAEGNYALLGIAASDEKYNMLKVGSFVYQKGSLPSVSVERDIHWINKKPPLAEPECGFWGKKCHNESDENKSNWAFISICSACVTTVVVGLACSFRYLRYERKLACLLWKIDPKDIILTTPTSWQNVTHFDKEEEPISVSEEEDLVPRKEDTNRMIGLYKGNTVYIKPICKQSIEITRSLRKEITQIREMRHENINPFIGACVDPSHICIVSLYCARSSLKVILKNSDINLDNMFIASLVADLTKGMTYIHESEIVSHGNLKSSTCLVDSRWVLQITSFGLHEFKAGRQLTMKGKKKRLKGLLWRAPELLRAVDPPERGTQKGDVYSFAIILHEVLGRKGPWGPRIISRKSIVERVTMKPAIYDGQPYRPSISSEVTNRWPDSVIRCLQECWWENPARRPDFRSINVKLREMFSELKSNIFDNMLSIMEKYASDLEGLVQERTHLLTEEKKKTEHLLLRMLPKPVAEQLKRGERVDAESFDSVTIYFSDIVGFTALSAVSTPLQVVDLLNDLYTCFDKIIGGFDVYKVETIGDAYMVVSGLPIRNGDCHAPEIAAMALHLLDAIRRFEIRHRPGDTLKLRIGIHSGPCVAGVVGSKMPRYCLFGDTVNTASRMESTGEPLKIHVSSSFQEILEKFDEFDVRERGVIQIKGKGEMKTYWLMGRSAKFTSLSDDAKLRRHTDSRLEVRFPPRVSASARNLRTASATRSCQWPLKIDSPPMSVSSCSALQTRKAARKSKWLRI